MGGNPLSNVDPDGDYFFGLFGSNKKMRDGARAFAAQTGGDVQNIMRRDIHVNYNTYQLKDGIFEVYNRNQYFREDGRLDFKNSIQNSGYDEELARTPQKPYPGTVEYVPIEMALLPASLPFRASSSLGKAALFTAEVTNPISGFGLNKSMFTKGGIQLYRGLETVSDGLKSFSTVSSKETLLLGTSTYHKHHVFPQNYRAWFSQRGIKNIDDYTVYLNQTEHLKGVHGKGLGAMPGKWNNSWKEFIKNNPNATPSEIFHHAEGMIKRYGLDHLPYEKY